jgi:cytochrome oxidase Cu insertion factor (SCO1/SenC/PrrC family)
VTEQAKPTGNGRTLLAMMVVFGAPTILALYLFFSGAWLKFGDASNMGNLVSPIRPVPDVTFQTSTGKPLALAELADNWIMITIANGCDEACDNALYIMQQSRSAQAVNRQYVERILVLKGDVSQAEAMAEKYRGTKVITGDSSAIAALEKTFAGLEQGVNGDIYLVDPKQHVMMSYNKDMPRESLLKDMEKLFKVNKMH